MSTVRFGTLCDLCGAGSRDYAHDANECADCGLDLCDDCAVLTWHIRIRETDVDQNQLWGCMEGER